MTTENIFQIALILATLFTTLVTGLLFSFAIIAMPGIKHLTDREFIRAFQGMDGIIQNNHPLFILVWGGSALLLLASVGLGYGHLRVSELALLIVATLLYIVGVQMPTLTINVPLNNKLQTINVDTIPEAAHKTARSEFEPRWNRWNNIRTVFAILTSTLLIVLLLVL